MSSDSSPPSSRRERERRQRRQAMLRAAQSVFAEKGYARATLDEIAERAEFGKGTLYNYFEGGKEDILFAVFEAIYDDICSMIEEVFGADRSLRESFRAFVTVFFEFSREREDLFMILAKESHRLAFSAESNRARFFREQRARMVDALRPALETAMDADEIQELPLESVAHLLLANANGMVVHRCLTEQDDECGPPVLQDADQAADFLTAMLFDGLTGATPASPTRHAHES
jgi:AcrR family transcriptional regulator